jgi:hypothetical protein
LWVLGPREGRGKANPQHGGADGLWFTKADAIDLPEYATASVPDVGNGDQSAL